MGLDVGEVGMPLDLGIDLKLFVARTAGRLAAKEPPAVDACIRGLEQERAKIEVFRSELPICARLIAEVIEVMKEEAAKRSAGRDAADDNDKRKWMSTAQLWVDADADPVPKEREHESAMPRPRLLGGDPSMAAGFGAMPPPPPPPPSEFFIRDDRASTSTQGLPGLPIMSSALKRPFSPAGDDRRPAKFATTMPPPGLSLQTLQTPQEQQSRKARRCWSTELHRQFVAALRQLGGPQVATPKQIREVMKVDGLTNDEVKSHLQKYRLHNKSPGCSSSSHPIVLVGDLWAHHEHSSSHSRSPEGPLQFSGSGVAVSALTGSDSCEEDDRSEMISKALHL